MLQKLGHEYEVASSALDGISRAESAPFDIVVTDIIMPGLNGLEAVKTIAHLVPPVPIIAMSGGSPANPAEQLGVLATRMGANVFLQKPFRLADLEKAIATVRAASSSPNQR
jgi:CheY-like chemotaxis protein